MSWTSSERLMYVQFTSYVCEDSFSFKKSILRKEKMKTSKKNVGVKVLVSAFHETEYCFSLLSQCLVLRDWVISFSSMSPPIFTVKVLLHWRFGILNKDMYIFISLNAHTLIRPSTYQFVCLFINLNLIWINSNSYVQKLIWLS